MIEYSLLKKRVGVRRYSMLESPSFTKAVSMQLPFGATYHFHSDGPDVLGPSMEDPHLKGITRPVFIDHVTELSSFEGNPRLLSISIDAVIKQHRRQNRTMRPLVRLDVALRDAKSILVENYCLLERRYRYQPTVRTGYYRWKNTWATIVARMSAIAKEAPNKQQFIQISLPRKMPPLSALIAMQNRGKQLPMAALKKFGTPEHLTILDLFMWAGPYRKSSVLDTIPEEHLKSINLVFADSGYWTFVNLGDINAWRNATQEEISEAVADEDLDAKEKAEIKKAMLKSGTVDPKIMQRSLLVFMLKMAKLRSAAAEDRVADAVLSEDDNSGTVNVSDDIKDAPVNVDAEGDVQQELTDTDVDVALDEGQVDKMIDETTKLLEEFEAMSEETETDTAEKERQLEDILGKEMPPEEKVVALADQYAKKGAISADAYRRAVRNAEKYKTIPSPIPGDSGTLSDLIDVNLDETRVPEDTRLVDKDVKGVTDKSMLRATKDYVDRTYLEKFHHKNVARMATAFQKIGASVQDYKIERRDNHFGSYEEHSVKIAPVGGSPSVVKFTIPAYEPDGSYRSGGVRYKTRTQRTDLPIRKINSHEVALNSYYGAKLFVSRSERAMFNYTRWLSKHITSIGLDGEDQRVTDLKFSDVFDRETKGSSVYAGLSKSFAGFTAGQCTFTFDSNDHKEQAVHPETIEGSSGELLYCGTRLDQTLWIDQQNQVFAYSDATKASEHLGTIETLCGFDATLVSRRPIEIVELNLAGKQIPIGAVLGWKLGLKNMIKFTGVDARIYDRFGEARYKPTDDEFKVDFEDKVLVANKGDRKAEFIIGSLLRFKAHLKRYPLRQFEKPEGWQAVMDKAGMGARHSRALRDVYDLFIDPITEDVLKLIGEPTEMAALFLRASEMLLTDDYKSPTDFTEMRDRNHERVAGFVYTEMCRAVRQFRSRSIVSNSSITMNPKAVWMNVVKDPAGEIAKEYNPVANLKEKDVVVYGGIGGRSGRILTEKNRTYNKTDIGVTGDGTVENGDVGTIMYLSGDPDYGNVYGVRKPIEDIDGFDPAQLVSVPTLLTPGSDRDDAKRIVLTSVLHGQTVSASGYVCPPVRTGMERMIARRTDKNFAHAARKPGKVVSIEEDSGSRVMLVEYDDGTKETFDVGRTYGKADGMIVPHELKTSLVPGKRFKKDDFLVYNENFFSPDPMDPTQVLWRAGAMARVIFVEENDTHEDSSAISRRFADRMVSKVTEVKSVRMDFSQEIRNAVRPGEDVDIESILCTVENPYGGADNPEWGDEAIGILRRIDAINPKADFIGTVERIEVFYNGEVEDMSESLKKLTRISNKTLSRHSQLTHDVKTTGKVDPGFQVDGVTIPADGAVVRFYITGDVGMEAGDKLIYAGQLKSIPGRVMTGEERTEDGQELDAHFGYNAVLARVVDSVSIMGFGGTVCIEAGKRVSKAYKGTK